jgi:hypothetical protein
LFPLVQRHLRCKSLQVQGRVEKQERLGIISATIGENMVNITTCHMCGATMAPISMIQIYKLQITMQMGYNCAGYGKIPLKGLDFDGSDPLFNTFDRLLVNMGYSFRVAMALITRYSPLSIWKFCTGGLALPLESMSAVVASGGPGEYAPEQNGSVLLQVPGVGRKLSGSSQSLPFEERSTQALTQRSLEDI